jgi:predicted phage terminase large subunit-like protein
MRRHAALDLVGLQAWVRQQDKLADSLGPDPDLSPRLSTDLGLADFVPAVSPAWSRPDHLAPLVDLFERIGRGEKVRALVSVPPQHGKTETCLHGLAWMLLRRPDQTHGYASYAAALSRSKSRLARTYAEAAGVELRRDSKALHEWRTPQGGGLLATGVGGPLTGSAVNGLLLVDDPHKNRAEAESAVFREKVQSWWRSTAVTRIRPTTSVLVVHTRWHDDDLIGWLTETARGRWEVVSLPAIAEVDDGYRKVGEPLWPQVFGLEALAERKEEVGEYDWASLYEQRPRPKGGTVFGDVHHYTVLPQGYRLAVGLDFAYTARTSSDWSIAVVLAEAQGIQYVVDVHRMQAPLPVFRKRLRALRALYPTARFVSYVGGTERGNIDLLNELPEPTAEEPNPLPLNIEAMSAVSDKFVRAQPTAARWNAGKILLPAQGASWAPAFVSGVKGFTGLPGGRDDDVDALDSASDVLGAPPIDTRVLRVRSSRR